MVNPRDWKHECSRQLISEKANVFSLYSMYLLGVALLEMGGQFERSIAYSLRCCIPPPEHVSRQFRASVVVAPNRPVHVHASARALL